MRDTIVAIATATGGGVGMVRLSRQIPGNHAGLYRRVRPCLSRGAAPG